MVSNNMKRQDLLVIIFVLIKYNIDDNSIYNAEMDQSNFLERMNIEFNNKPRPKKKEILLIV